MRGPRAAIDRTAALAWVLLCLLFYPDACFGGLALAWDGPGTFVTDSPVLQLVLRVYVTGDSYAYASGCGTYAQMCGSGTPYVYECGYASGSGAASSNASSVCVTRAADVNVTVRAPAGASFVAGSLGDCSGNISYTALGPGGVTFLLKAPSLSGAAISIGASLSGKASDPSSYCLPASYSFAASAFSTSSPQDVATAPRAVSYVPCRGDDDGDPCTDLKCTVGPSNAKVCTHAPRAGGFSVAWTTDARTSSSMLVVGATITYAPPGPGPAPNPYISVAAADPAAFAYVDDSAGGAEEGVVIVSGSGTPVLMYNLSFAGGAGAAGYVFGATFAFLPNATRAGGGCRGFASSLLFTTAVDPGLSACSTHPYVVDYVPCYDRNPCTVDMCEESGPPVGGVYPAPTCDHSASACEDGLECTHDGCTPEMECDGGRCVYRAACEFRTICDDGLNCTVDQCSADGHCVFSDSCTGGARCAPRGECSFATVDCDDGVDCTTDLVGEDGLCRHVSNCEDGLPCTADRCITQRTCETVQSCGTNCTGPSGNQTCAYQCAQVEQCYDAGTCVSTVSCPSGYGCRAGYCKADGTCGYRDTCPGGSVCMGSGGCAFLALSCDDGLPCTADALDSNGTCHHLPDCDDGIACTADQCTASGCTHTSTCYDGNPCTQDICTPGGQCVFNSTCAPGQVCGPLGTCAYFSVSCDDGNACTDDLLGPDGRCRHVPMCDDGLNCTRDVCGPGGTCSFVDVCAQGGVPCMTGVCTAGGCSYRSACPAGMFCSLSAGTCLFTQRSCDDGKACTADLLHANGTCYSVLACDDGNPCTVDACGPAGGCVHTPKNCSDGIACTVDSCDVSTGECGHAPSCPGLQACDARLGVCLYTEVICDDGVACTIDAMLTDGSGTCTNTPNCDDGLECTVDRCNANGTCSHTVSCDDGLPCTVDACGPDGRCVHRMSCSQGMSCSASGACVYTAMSCDDGLACTRDYMSPNGSCAHVTACDSGPKCARGVCQANGLCAYVSTCDDGLACTADACDLSGVCRFTSTCPDGKLCAQDGTCVAPTAWRCDDGLACTVDTVDAIGNCHHEASCEDGNPCTEDVCSSEGSGACVHHPVLCDDGLDCTDDACSPYGGGCVHTINCPPGQACGRDGRCAEVGAADPSGPEGRAAACVDTYRGVAIGTSATAGVLFVLLGLSVFWRSKIPKAVASAPATARKGKSAAHTPLLQDYRVRVRDGIPPSGPLYYEASSASPPVQVPPVRRIRAELQPW